MHYRVRVLHISTVVKLSTYGFIVLTNKLQFLFVFLYIIFHTLLPFLSVVVLDDDHVPKRMFLTSSTY